MSVTDLSYARNRRDENPAILALDLRGWNCAWAINGEDRPLHWGRLVAKDHMDGKPVPPSTRIAGIFRGLLEASVDRGVCAVVTEVKANPGPLWSVPPILATAFNVRYAELRDWVDELEVDRKAIRLWATVTIGKTIEDDLVASAIGMAVAAAKMMTRQWRGEQGLVG
jgi:hypothetical protein